MSHYTAQKKRHFFGTSNIDGKAIYLSSPTWDCDWYWSFGYLGNTETHYHLNGYQAKNHYLKLEDGSHKHITEKRNISMYDALLADYDLADAIKANLWKFCELALTAYKLKETAELIHMGGAHMTTNPCSDQIKGLSDMGGKINTELLPAVFMALDELLSRQVDV